MKQDTQDRPGGKTPAVDMPADALEALPEPTPLQVATWTDQLDTIASFGGGNPILIIRAIFAAGAAAALVDAEIEYGIRRPELDSAKPASNISQVMGFPLLVRLAPGSTRVTVSRLIGSGPTGVAVHVDIAGALLDVWSRDELGALLRELIAGLIACPDEQVP